MSQTSGSIVIDTSSMSAAVIEGLKPVFEQVARSIAALGTGVPVSQQEFNTALRASPAMNHVSDYEAAAIMNAVSEAGLLVVRIPEPSMAADAVTAELDAAALKLQREDEWFRHGDRT